MLYWQVHLMISNMNWLVTSLSHIFSSCYHIAAYIARMHPSESKTRQMSFVALLLMCHMIYIWLSYFSDSQKKINFTNEVILTKKKENLSQILELYPDILMIVSKKPSDSAKNSSSSSSTRCKSIISHIQCCINRIRNIRCRWMASQAADLKEQGDDEDFLFQNKLMKEFSKDAKIMYWDVDTEQFVKADNRIHRRSSKQGPQVLDEGCD